MHYVRVALAVIVLTIIAVFSVQNLSAVEVSFLAWSFNIPKFFLILGTYVMGMITGWGLVELAKRAFQKPKQ